jgi:DNA-directed RNA polymerase specialized sigma24 family protein
VLLRNELQAALADLTDARRDAIVQTVLLDRPYVQLAAVLGLCAATVRSRVHYAVQRSRLRLQPAV